jgi:hypothetical protein
MQSGISIPELEGARPGLTIVIAGVDPVLIPGLNGVSALDSGLTGVGDRRNRA